VQDECRQFWKDLPTPPTFYYQCNDPLVTEEGLFLFPFFFVFFCVEDLPIPQRFASCVTTSWSLEKGVPPFFFMGLFGGIT